MSHQGRISTIAGLALASLTVLTSGAARGETAAATTMPGIRWRLSALGYARGIPNAWSASRDTPRMEMAPYPRPVTTAGGEFALLTLAEGSRRWRLGFAGFIEHDNTGRTNTANSGPLAASNKGRMLWRGSYAYYLAVQLDALGRRICGLCTAEVALSYRHESEHATASNSGGESEDYTTQPYVGDDVIVDAALAQWFGHWYLQQRLVGMWFVPGQSSYSWASAADVHVRLTRWRALHPFFSGYAEHRSGTTSRSLEYPDAYRLRAMLGVSFPSNLGDVMVFGFGDVGNNYGVQANTVEATLGCGVRLALGRAW